MKKEKQQENKKPDTETKKARGRPKKEKPKEETPKKEKAKKVEAENGKPEKRKRKSKTFAEYHARDFQIRKVLFDFSPEAVEIKKRNAMPVLIMRDKRICERPLHEFGFSSIKDIIYLRQQYPKDLVYMYDFTTRLLLQFNLKNNVEAIGEALGVKKLDDWYETSNSRKVKLLLRTPFEKVFGMRLWKALSLVYPEHTWQVWKFRTDWDTKHSSIRAYTDWFASIMGVKTMDDWYLFKVSDFKAKGGLKILAKYNNSLMGMLAAAYPEHHWLEWRFSYSPRQFWKTERTAREYLDWLATMMNLKSMDDWYSVRYSDFKHYGGQTFLQYHGSVPKALHWAYPNHNWVEENFDQPSFTKRMTPFSEEEQVVVQRDPTKRLRRKNLLAQIKTTQRELELQFSAKKSRTNPATEPPVGTPSGTAVRTPAETAEPPANPPTYNYVDGIYDDSDDVAEANFPVDLEEDEQIEDPLGFDFGDEDETSDSPREISAKAPSQKNSVKSPVQEISEEPLASSSSPYPSSPSFPPLAIALSATLSSIASSLSPPSSSPYSFPQSTKTKEEETSDEFDIDPFAGDEYDYEASSESGDTSPPPILPPITPPTFTKSSFAFPPPSPLSVSPKSGNTRTPLTTPSPSSLPSRSSFSSSPTSPSQPSPSPFTFPTTTSHSSPASPSSSISSPSPSPFPSSLSPSPSPSPLSSSDSQSFFSSSQSPFSSPQSPFSSPQSPFPSPPAPDTEEDEFDIDPFADDDESDRSPEPKSGHAPNTLPYFPPKLVSIRAEESEKSDEFEGSDEFEESEIAKSDESEEIEEIDENEIEQINIEEILEPDEPEPGSELDSEPELSPELLKNSEPGESEPDISEEVGNEMTIEKEKVKVKEEKVKEEKVKEEKVKVKEEKVKEEKVKEETVKEEKVKEEKVKEEKVKEEKEKEEEKGRKEREKKEREDREREAREKEDRDKKERDEREKEARERDERERNEREKEARESEERDEKNGKKKRGKAKNNSKGSEEEEVALMLASM